MLKVNNLIKVAIKNIIVAFIFVIIILALIFILSSKQISTAIKLINSISITKNEENNIQPLKLEQNKLNVMPEFGKKYGTLKIEDLDVNLNLYYGDLLSILRNGVGQTAGSSFPGEGGTIICMAHNTEGFLKNLNKIKMGTNILITTEYGKFTYQLYNTRIVDQNDLDAISMDNNEETLILYTCYPNNTFGHAKQRFITYSKLTKAEVL